MEFDGHVLDWRMEQVARSFEGHDKRWMKKHASVSWDGLELLLVSAVPQTEVARL